MDKEVTRLVAGRFWCLGLAVLVVACAVTWLSVDAGRAVSDRARNLVATQMPQLRTISSLQDAVSRRTLHLYLYYATMDDRHWRNLQATQEEFAGLLQTVDLAATATRLLVNQAAAFDAHATRFATEMSSGSSRDWDELREHLGNAQTAADALTTSLASLAAEIRERAGQGGNHTLTEVSRLGRMQLYVMVVMLAVGLLVMGILHGRTRDQAELFRRAFLDRLTGLPNRARLQQDWKARISHELSGPDANIAGCAILTIELDRYHLLTSAFGHGYGDGVIKAMATRLDAACARAAGSVAVYQLAAAAWIVILDPAAGSASPDDAVPNILEAFDEPLTFDEHELTVTCSAGITYYPAHGRSIDELLRNGNSALQRALADGGDCVAVYDARMHAKAERFLAIESAMRRGLENDEFELYYQPKISATDFGCHSAEALIRWRRDGQLISPAEFIPVAEESGLIIPLGEWVLADACRQWTEWQSEGLAPPPVAVNVSAQQFQSADFVNRLRETLAANAMPAGMLELEITEEATFDDPRAVVATMKAAKRLGVALALDDFGTGYSSLSCLTSFPLDVIKIDQKFIREMQASKQIFAIVEAIVALSRELGFKIVAEGVETRQQEEQLRTLGCDVLQGYFYCRPVPARDYVRFFVDRRPRRASPDGGGCAGVPSRGLAG